MSSRLFFQSAITSIYNGFNILCAILGLGYIALQQTPHSFVRVLLFWLAGRLFLSGESTVSSVPHVFFFCCCLLFKYNFFFPN